MAKLWGTWRQGRITFCKGEKVIIGIEGFRDLKCKFKNSMAVRLIFISVCHKYFYFLTIRSLLDSFPYFK
jgi:hypothetical protein